MPWRVFGEKRDVVQSRRVLTPVHPSEPACPHAGPPIAPFFAQRRAWDAHLLGASTPTDLVPHPFLRKEWGTQTRDSLAPTADRAEDSLAPTADRAEDSPALTVRLGPWAL